jgi:hypothetical protein
MIIPPDLPVRLHVCETCGAVGHGFEVHYTICGLKLKHVTALGMPPGVINVYGANGSRVRIENIGLPDQCRRNS